MPDAANGDRATLTHAQKSQQQPSTDPAIDTYMQKSRESVKISRRQPKNN